MLTHLIRHFLFCLLYFFTRSASVFCSLCFLDAITPLHCVTAVFCLCMRHYYDDGGVDWCPLWCYFDLEWTLNHRQSTLYVWISFVESQMLLTNPLCVMFESAMQSAKCYQRISLHDVRNCFGNVWIYFAKCKVLSVNLLCEICSVWVYFVKY